MVGASGFEPPTSWSRTRRSSQAEPRPDVQKNTPRQSPPKGTTLVYHLFRSQTFDPAVRAASKTYSAAILTSRTGPNNPDGSNGESAR